MGPPPILRRGAPSASWTPSERRWGPSPPQWRSEPMGAASAAAQALGKPIQQGGPMCDKQPNHAERARDPTASGLSSLGRDAAASRASPSWPHRRSAGGLARGDRLAITAHGATRASIAIPAPQRWQRTAAVRPCPRRCSTRRSRRSTQAVVRRNPGEAEFHQAVREVLESLGPVLAKHPEFAEPQDHRAHLRARAADHLPRAVAGRPRRGAHQPRLPRRVQQRARPVQGRPALPPVGLPRHRQVPRLRADLQERAHRHADRRRQGRLGLRPRRDAPTARSCASARAS